MAAVIMSAGRLFVALVWVAALLAGGSFRTDSAQAQDKPGKLVIVGWGGISNTYGKTLFSDPFENSTGIQVEWIAGPLQQVSGIQAQSAAGQILWDVGNALYDEQALFLYQKGLIAKFPADLRARLEKLMPGGVSDYGITYASVTDVIACNAMMVKVCPRTPREFFDFKDFPGPRAFYIGSPLVAMALALQADGVPKEKVFPMDIDRAFRKLQEIKPYVKLFYRAGDQSEQMFRSGEVAIGVIWNGRARNLAMNPSSNLKLEVSFQGGYYEPAYSVVFEGAPHKQAAFRYLEWVAAHPDAMAKYAEKTGYGFPSADLFNLLPEAIAKWLPEYPGHWRQQVTQDTNFYFQNKTDIDSRWREYTSGN